MSDLEALKNRRFMKKTLEPFICSYIMLSVPKNSFLLRRGECEGP